MVFAGNITCVMNKHFSFSTTTTIQQRPPTSTATTSRNHRSITPTTSAHPNNNDKWPHHVTTQRMEDDNGRGQPGTSTDGDNLARQRMCHVVTVQVSMVTALPLFLFIRDTGERSYISSPSHTCDLLAITGTPYMAIFWLRAMYHCPKSTRELAVSST